MYVSIALWRDLTDGHLYREGDTFPFDGREVSVERLTELETGRNRAGLRLIRASEGSGEPTEGQEAEADTGAKEAQETATEESEPEPEEPKEAPPERKPRKRK